MNPRTIPAPNELLTIGQVAEGTGFPIATLRAWRRLHEGPPPVAIGSRWFYRVAALLDWLRAWWPAHAARLTHWLRHDDDARQAS